jgi:acyl carrier protein
MEYNQITADLRQFIRQHYGVPETDADFNDDVDLFNYGYIDSFGAVALTAFIERQFSIKFDNADWVSFPLSTINQIAAFVVQRQKGEI